MNWLIRIGSYIWMIKLGDFYLLLSAPSLSKSYLAYQNGYK